MKKDIAKKLREELLKKGTELDNDLISQEKKAEESERDIVEKGEDKSVLPKEG